MDGSLLLFFEHQAFIHSLASAATPPFASVDYGSAHAWHGMLVLAVGEQGGKWP
jgi:hypothetical protein